MPRKVLERRTRRRPARFFFLGMAMTLLFCREKRCGNRFLSFKCRASVHFFIRDFGFIFATKCLTRVSSTGCQRFFHEKSQRTRGELSSLRSGFCLCNLPTPCSVSPREEPKRGSTEPHSCFFRMTQSSAMGISLNQCSLHAGASNREQRNYCLGQMSGRKSSRI